MRFALLALLLLTGCAPETRTVDRPDVAPMDLPEWGWTISFVKTVNGGDPEPPAEYDCNLERSSSGTAMTYCGFTVAVFGDGFSFDTEWTRAFSFFYGPMLLQVRGAGDAAGAEIAVESQFADGETWEPLGLAYTVDYEIEHLAELE